MKRIPLKNHQLRNWISPLVGVAVLVATMGSIDVSKALAQVPKTLVPNISLNSVVYAAKFVCGFKPGFTPPQERVINGSGIYNYRDFEPGSYATALNVLFLTGPSSTSINVLLSVPETSQNSALKGINLGPLTLANFDAAKVNCEDIAQAVRGPLPQVADLEVIEGFLYIPRPTDDLIVEAVYSYSSQIGSLGSEPLRLNGGIGLGSSIHVQNIEPKTYSVQFSGPFKTPNSNLTP